jgi:hypothetical protein
MGGGGRSQLLARCKIAISLFVRQKNVVRVYSLALSYSLLGKTTMEKICKTFQELSTNYPGTPFSGVT